MAYGNSTATELGVVSQAVDVWLNEDTNGIDLFSGHSPLIATLFDRSQEPGGEYQFMVEQGPMPEAVKIGVWGKPQNYSAGSTPVRGVTRANQVNGFTPTVDNPATNARYLTAHYEGMAYMNLNDLQKTSGPQGRINAGGQIKDQIAAAFFELIGNHIEDNTAGGEDRLMALNWAFSNTGSPGGIDQTDSANNSWWRTTVNNTAEVINTATIDQVFDACTFNTGVRTGIRRATPDLMLLGPGTNSGSSQYSTLRQELKASQRQEIDGTIRGGGAYMLYNGMKCFRSTRLTAGQSLIINSTTLGLRLSSKMPEGVTEGFVPTSGKPSMMERGYNWFLVLAGYSMKHNGLLTGKAA